MIYSSMLAIWITSALRRRIRYEIFYYVHQLALLLFVLLVLHTLGKFRSKLNQCYPWVAPSFLYYISDRLYMRYFQKYRTPLVSATTIDADINSESHANKNKAMILRIRRPALFTFKAGQYAYLRFNKIDNKNWHPFSIMSDPDSQQLEFFIGVVGDNDSWTSKLYEELKKYDNDNTDPGKVEFEVMGPYGNSLGKPEDYSHVLAMGSGTGFVPVLSLLKNHMGRLLRLEPEAHCQRLKDNFDRVTEQQIASKKYKGSLCSKMLRSLPLCTTKQVDNEQCGSVTSMKVELDAADEKEKTQSRMMKMQLLAVHATRSFYGNVLLTLVPMFGVAMIGFTISWNTIPDPTVPLPWSFYHMRLTAMACSALFQLLYAIVALCIWDANSLATFVDTVLIIVTPFADWLWFERIIQDGHMVATDIILFTILMGYFVARLWWAAVRPSNNTSWRIASQIPGVTALERLDAVWIVRNAEMVSQLLPDINEQYEKLVYNWGQERANQVCRIQIYVTDKNHSNIEALKRDEHIIETAVYRAGCIKFGRPNLEQLVENHTLDLVANHHNTYSLLSYCGSVGLSSELQRIKVNQDLLKTITGNDNHQMEFLSECHGGPQRKNKKEAKSSNNNDHVAKVDDSLTNKPALETETTMEETNETSNDITDLEDVDIDERLSVAKKSADCSHPFTTRSTTFFQDGYKERKDDV